LNNVIKYTRIILNIVIPLVQIAVVCLLGPKLLGFFMPFVIGWVIAMIANPLVRFLESKVKIVRKHSSVIIVVAVLALVVGLSYFLISRLFIQAFSLIRELPELYRMASSEITEISVRYESMFRMLPQSVQEWWTTFANDVGQYLNLLVQKIASPTVELAGSFAKGIPGALVSVVVTILSAYFFLGDRDRIFDFGKRYLPKGSGRYYHFLKGDMKMLVSGYFVAQFRIMFVIAALMVVGLLILGIPYAFVLGILIAVLDFLPLFGTGTVLIPWAVVKLFTADYSLAVGLALLYVLTQVVRQVIQPKIVGDSMGLPPFLSLLFLYLGFKLKGIGGMILAVPVGILGLKLFEYGIFDSMIDNIKILVHDIEEFRKGSRREDR